MRFGTVEVTDPHFPQIGVHILAEAIEQRLAQTAPPSTALSRRKTIHKCSTSRSKRPLTVSGTPKSR